MIVGFDVRVRLPGRSSSTIQVYYRNKEDMLNKLYLMMKKESGAVVLKGNGKHHSVKEVLGMFMKKSSIS